MSLADINLPPRIFMYTLDQVAGMLGMTEVALRTHIHFNNRNFGKPIARMLLAHDVGMNHKAPEWRISEDELVRYLKLAGFRFHRNGSFR